MDAIKSFNVYILAQKRVGTHFIVIGIILILLGTASYFLSGTEFSDGVSIGSFGCAFLIITGGMGYRDAERRLARKQRKLFKKDGIKFLQVERERMKKVARDYAVYQLVFGSIVIAGSICMALLVQDYFRGISFSVVLLFAAVMMVEAFSQRSVHAYYEAIHNGM